MKLEQEMTCLITKAIPISNFKLQRSNPQFESPSGHAEEYVMFDNFLA